MSTPEATQTEKGKWVVPQRKLRVVFPEEGMGDAREQSQLYPCCSLPSLSLKLPYFLNLGCVSPGLDPSFRFFSSLTPSPLDS